MRNRLAISVALLGFGGAVVAVALMLNDYVRADVLGGPLPAPSPPPDTIQLTPVEKLGKLMLYDSTLSNPPGYSCATCHVAETSPARSPGSCPAGSAIASPKVISTLRSVPRVPTMTPVYGLGWAAISGMAAFPTSPSKGCNRPSIPTRWRTLLRDPIRLLMADIHRSSFRGSRTGHIPHYSSRCTARMSSKCTLRSRSTNSSVRHSLPTSRREQSVRSVRSTMPPSMVRQR